MSSWVYAFQLQWKNQRHSWHQFITAVSSQPQHTTYLFNASHNPALQNQYEYTFCHLLNFQPQTIQARGCTHPNEQLLPAEGPTCLSCSTVTFSSSLAVVAPAPDVWNPFSSCRAAAASASALHCSSSASVARCWDTCTTHNYRN